MGCPPKKWQEIEFRCHHPGAKITLRHSIDFDVLNSNLVVPNHENPQFFCNSSLNFAFSAAFILCGVFDLDRILHDVFSMQAHKS